MNSERDSVVSLTDQLGGLKVAPAATHILGGPETELPEPGRNGPGDVEVLATHQGTPAMGDGSARGSQAACHDSTVDDDHDPGGTSSAAEGFAAEDVVAGMEDTLASLRELIAWPWEFKEAADALGIQWPRGLLLCGPPGCGKTLAVQAICRECSAWMKVVTAGKGLEVVMSVALAAVPPTMAWGSLPCHWPSSPSAPPGLVHLLSCCT